MVAFGELAVIFCVGVVDTIFHGEWRLSLNHGELYRDPYFTGHYLIGLSLIVDEQYALTRC